MTETLEIVVDGLSVDVDKVEYEADPADVIDQVRHARAGTVGDLSDYEEFPNFDVLGALATELNPEEVIS